jgi:hypothetical protein
MTVADHREPAITTSPATHARIAGGPESSLRLKPSRSSEPVAARRRPASSDESLATS